MPPFEKGHKKVAGRKKGTPNRFNSNLVAICESEGVDPFRALLKMAKARDAEPAHRLGALKELCEYLYPKRRRVEFADDLQISIVREVEALSKLPTKELKRMAQEELDKIGEEPDVDSED